MGDLVSYLQGKILNSIYKHSNGCWVWTGAKNKQGYGILRYKKKMYRAHRASLHAFRGAPLHGKHIVQHLCNNTSCVNPQHLQKGTHKDNMQYAVKLDRVAKGEQISSSKLTEKDVIEIKALCESGYKKTEVAKRFGISREYVYRILSGKRWKHVG